MKTKKVTVMVLAAVLCMSLAAGGSAYAEESAADLSGVSIRVAWWGSQERHNSTIEALDAFAEETGAEFTYEYNSWDAYFEQLATQAVGSNLPDVIQMSTTDIINYSRNNQVIDLAPYVEAGIIDFSNMGESALDGGRVDDAVAGITTGTNTICVIYNKNIFDDAGIAYPESDWTWSEYLQTAQDIYEATGIASDIPFLNEFRWAAEEIVRCYGYDFFSEDGTALPWAEDETVAAGLADMIQAIYDGVQAGYFMDPEVQYAWSATEDNYIVQGQSAMAWLLSNYYGTYAAAAEVEGQELDLVMAPVVDEGVGSGMYLNSNMYWCISANSENPEAAAAVINYLINDEGAAAVIGTDRGISLSSAIRTMLAEAEDTDEYSSIVLEYVNDVSEVVASVNPADPVNSAELISVLKNDYVAVMYGEMTAEDCVEDFIAQAQVILP